MDSNFEDCLKEKLRKNKEIIKKLNEIRSTMKTHHMVCNGFKTAGTGVSAAGTVLLTVSILAIPLTGGLSLLGGGWGLGLSLGGGATTILTNSIDSSKTENSIQTIQSLLDSCENLNNNLQQHLEFINSLVSELGEHNIPQDEAILRVFHGLAQGTLNQLTNPKELIMKTLVTLAIAKVTFKEITKVYVDGVLVSTSVKTWAQVTKFIGKATVVLSVLTTAADIVFLIRDWVSTHPSIKVIDDLKRQIDDESKSLEAMYYLIEQLKDSKEAAKKGVTAAVGGTVDALTLGSGGELAKAFTNLGIDTGEKIAVDIVAKEVANQALDNKGIGGKVLDVDEFKDARTASTSTGNSTSSISTVGVTATTSGNESTSASGKGNPPNQPPRRDDDRDDSDSDSDSELTEDELLTVEDPELLEKLIEERLKQLRIHPDRIHWKHMDVNSNNGMTNCYYVSLAALMKLTLFEAIDVSQEFAQNCATIKEFCELCRLFNLEAEFPELLNEERARKRNDVLMEHLGSILKPGRKKKFVLAYRTSSNTCHMIVLVAGKTRKGEVKCTLIDFQKAPQEPGRFPTLQHDEEILHIIELKKKSKKKPEQRKSGDDYPSPKRHQ